MLSEAAFKNVGNLYVVFLVVHKTTFFKIGHLNILLGLKTLVTSMGRAVLSG